jgi:hypothetical protein
MENDVLIEQASPFIQAAANAPAARIETYYATDIIQEEFPNKLLPKGAVRDLNPCATPAQGPAGYGRADDRGGECGLVRSMRGSRGDCLCPGILKPGDQLRARFAKCSSSRRV